MKVSKRFCIWLLIFKLPFPSVLSFSPSFLFVLQEIYSCIAKIKLLKTIHHNGVLSVVLCTNQIAVIQNISREA